MSIISKKDQKGTLENDKTRVIWRDEEWDRTNSETDVNFIYLNLMPDDLLRTAGDRLNPICALKNLLSMKVLRHILKDCFVRRNWTVIANNWNYKC